VAGESAPQRSAPPTRDATPLSRVEGSVVVTAAEAILKGALESEMPVQRVLVPPRAPFLPLLRIAADEAVAPLLQRHGCEVLPVGDAARAVSLGWRAAMGGRPAVLLLGNDQLYYAMPALQALPPIGGGGALAMVIEDNPELAPAAGPRRLMADLGVPILEPAGIDALRDSIEIALRLGRAGGRPVAVVVDVSLLRSLDTIEARPNRVVDRIDAAVAARRRRRVPRSGESGGILRLARRLELNTARSMPSPGEREPLGLLVAGGAVPATLHLLSEVGLAGRVPLVSLGLTAPIDDALVLRLLQRCDQVVVIESRPGALAAALAEIIEASRRRGEQPALVWWRRLPPGSGEEDAVLPADREIDLDAGPLLEPGDALRPSMLARKLLRLLHPIRPTLQVASRLAQLEPALRRLEVPPRGAGLGFAGASARVREVLDEVDRAIRRGSGGEAPVALAIDGIDPAIPALRTVPAEVWDRKRFSFEGPAAVRQAVRARGGRGARIMVVCDVGGEDELDVERLALAALPADAGEAVKVDRVDLHDRNALRERLIEAALGDRLQVLIARDGPPPRFDPIAAERMFAEVDRLGYEPRRRLVWLAESACDLAIASPSDRNTLEGSTIGRPLEAPPQLRTRGWMRRIAIRTGAAVRVRIRPFLEQVDVIRTRPPVTSGRDESAGLPLPRPVHASAARWRGHLAGYRGDSPGVAAAILCEAGRGMGYRVQATWEPAPIGPGRRAWAQVLFTRDGGEAAPLVAGIPYGEADLLLGLDPEETLRALGPDPLLRVASSDRTHAVVNLGGWEDQSPIDGLEAALRGAVRRACRDGGRVEDLISICRETFLSERLLDAMLLGVAFQSGLIPVSTDAMQQAVARVERRGYGRIVEAFGLGRRIAAGRRPRGSTPPPEAAVQRAIRRATRELAGPRARRRRRIRDLIDEALSAMPGLLESRAGRHSAVEFASLLVAASVWGGLDHANRYAERIRRLYAVDRGDTGRELTRLAIGPVGEAMLVRDLFYVSAMSLTPWHLARIRERLRVRTARGDRIERRFLYRIDGLALGRRGRLDLRTSDWLPIVLARLRRWIPWRWRGTPSERRLRDTVLDSVERAMVEVGAAEGDDAAYRRWCETFRRMGGGGRRRLRGPAVIAESEDPHPPRG